MKYYLIHDPKSTLSHRQFLQTNPHLTNQLISIEIDTNQETLRSELLNRNWITHNNQYDPYNLAIANAHLNIWQDAVDKQTDITIFHADITVHPDFLNHQKNSLKDFSEYDFITWGYNLNWPLCLQLHPTLPRVFYTFPGHEIENISTPNNQLINAETYCNHSLDLQIARIFSFAGLGCYSLSWQGANKLLKECLPLDNISAPSQQDHLHGSNYYVLKPSESRSNLSLDIEINCHLETINAYVSVPLLAIMP